MGPTKKILIKKTQSRKSLVEKPKPEKINLQVPPMEEIINRLKKDNAMLDRVRKAHDPNYISTYKGFVPLEIRRKPRINKTREENYRDSILDRSIKPNQKSSLLTDTITNRRLVKILAKNYSATLRDAIEISEMLLTLNQAQLSGTLYYIEQHTFPIVKLKKKIKVIQENCFALNAK